MKRMSLLVLVLVLFAGLSAAHAADEYTMALVKVWVTQGKDVPIANAKVTFKNIDKGTETSMTTGKGGWAWAILPTKNLLEMNVDAGGDKYFATKRSLIGKRNYAVRAHVAFMDSDNVRFSFTKLGNREICKTNINIVPAAPGYTVQFIQTDVNPDIIWKDHWPLNDKGHAQMWVGQETTWNVKVYKNGRLCGQESFKVGPNDTKKTLTVKVADSGGAAADDGGM